MCPEKISISIIMFEIKDSNASIPVQTYIFVVVEAYFTLCDWLQI